MNTPKKRICPSSSRSICSKSPRHRRGDNMGINPSRMSIRPNAIRRVSIKVYFLGADPVPELRMPLKNSELAGSRTITSLLLAKLVL